MKLNHYDILVAPILTEKSIKDMQNGKYTFNVHVSADKDQVKSSVELAFKVKVADVNIMNLNGKVKTRAGRLTKFNDTKKAIVTLEQGHSIDYSKMSGN